MKIRGWKGFTLLELLLAMALFSLIAVSIYSVFRCGIVSWRKVNSVVTEYKDARLTLDRISTELKNSFHMEGFESKGDSDELTFLSVLDRYRPGVGMEQVVANITYYLEPEPRKKTKVFKRKEVLYNVEDHGSDVSECMGSIVDLKFEYALADVTEEGYTWNDSWESGDGILVGVRLEIVLSDPETSEETRLVKSILIPAGP